MYRPYVTDRWLLRGLRVAALVSGALVLLIAGFVLLEAAPALGRIGPGRWLADRGWFPHDDHTQGQFAMVAMLVGSLAVTLGAVALAAPLGVLSALFLRFYAPPRVAWCQRRALELLAGVPSVVFGLWGLATLAPLIAQIRAPGTSLLAGVLILAAMILPTIALLSDSALRAVPPERLAAAAALGLSRATTIRRIVLPGAASGLLTAIILGAARAVGETMAVLMVCGNVARVPGSLLDPVRTLTANIALELGYASGDHRAALFVSGLLLVVMVLALVAGAEALRGRRP